MYNAIHCYRLVGSLHLLQVVVAMVTSKHQEGAILAPDGPGRGRDHLTPG